MIDPQDIKKLNIRLKAIETRLRNNAKKIQGVVAREFRISGQRMRKNIISSMENTPKTGHHYKRNGGYHIASSPGNPPAIDHGDLVKKIVYDVTNERLKIGAKIDHGLYMEKGTKGLAMGGGYIVAPRPWLEPEVNKEIPDIESRIGKVTYEILKGSFS